MNRSENIDLLVTAFSKAQGSFEELIPNEESAGGKFANLQAILKATRKALSENGLSFYQQIELSDEGTGSSLLISMVSHSSGQWISTSNRIVAGTTFRETFNCIEAYRRLSALLLLGIAPSHGDPLIRDDNGEEQLDKKILVDMRKGEQGPKHEFVDTINKDQYQDLMIELEGYEQIAKGIQQFYRISSIADLPKSEFFTVQGKIRKLKKTHEEYKRDK